MIITKTSWSSTSGGTNLLHTLQQDGIDTVLVCGLITSVCVQHSAFGVFEAGYRTILVTDACADRGRERHEAALALYGNYMYELRSVESIRVELEEQKEEEEVVQKKKTKKGNNDDERNIQMECCSSMEGVLSSSVSSLSPFHNDNDQGDNVVGHRDTKKKMKIMMIKSESNDSLTSATSYDDSVSSIEDHHGVIEAVVAATLLLLLNERIR